MILVSAFLFLTKKEKEDMGSPLHELKRQASFFFKEKFKVARLALTDVTPAELLTEEAIYGDSLSPDTHSMRLISRAAFEVDDYCRIVDILHKRLSRFDEKDWRASYKALILLEFLLTHGPQSIAEEFQIDQDAIQEMVSFRYVDERGFNWGLSVVKKSERVFKLLQDRSFLKEERTKARQLTFGIKGFEGSFRDRANQKDWRAKEIIASEKPTRWNSYMGDHIHGEDDVFISDDDFWEEENTGKEEPKGEGISLETGTLLSSPNGLSIAGESDGQREEEDHPFFKKEYQTKVSLLSSIY